MNDWWKKCEHGELRPHKYQMWNNGRYQKHPCPGGSPVTAADLEGEKVRVCQVHDNSKACIDGGHCEASHTSELSNAPVRCQLVERLLIPIPEAQPVEP